MVEGGNDDGNIKPYHARFLARILRSLRLYEFEQILISYFLAIEASDRDAVSLFVEPTLQIVKESKIMPN